MPELFSASYEVARQAKLAARKSLEQACADAENGGKATVKAPRVDENIAVSSRFGAKLNSTRLR